jgi:hypothetical protein
MRRAAAAMRATMPEEIRRRAGVVAAVEDPRTQPCELDAADVHHCASIQNPVSCRVGKGFTVEKGFLASLFDVSFSTLITPKVIKVIYLLSMVLIGLAALVFVVGAFQSSAGAGLFVLIVGAPLVSLVYLIYTRVVLEVIIALFRIMESNVELVALQRAAGSTGPAAPSTPPPPPPPGPTAPPEPQGA